MFHPCVWSWFSARFGTPTTAQTRGWAAISQGKHTLIAAPTGSGKTLAAFLWSISELLKKALAGRLQDQTSVVYVSPLKALGNDIERNLADPLRGIRELAPQGLPEIRVAVRSGDTPMAERQRMRKKPPHILITTPESLFILLTAESSRRFLATADTVIVDEIHAMAGDRRGAHLALSLERLDRLCGKRLRRIGLSATQKPIEEITSLLVGAPDDACEVVNLGHKRDLLLEVEVPDRELGAIASNELRAEVFDRIAKQVRAHHTTLVFAHTRRLVERVAHELTARLGEGKVAAHHGSLSRSIRLEAERKLKAGELSVMVASASLELGIDIGQVDLVCHLGAPRSIASLLQRVGRSGHSLSSVPKGRIYPLTRDELVQATAAVQAVHKGWLDGVRVQEHPLDVLAQQMVAIASSEAIAEDDLFALVRTARPYRDLSRKDFDALVQMLSEGIATGRGRRSAYLHRDGVHHILRGRRNARLAAITSGGAIPDVADYDVVEDPTGALVGKVNEDFAIESMAGDVFLLGNRPWRIRRVEAGRVRVEDATGLSPTIPFWLGEAPARSPELSLAVAELREAGPPADLEASAAEQLTNYFAETRRVLGTIPTLRTIVAERFFDEAGGMQLVLHAPFGARINRALGLALRKRFCVTFDFELQAAATDDGVVISLSEKHSFPLEAVFGMLRSDRLQQDLVHAVLTSPMFTNRWRWNASRALAVLRFAGGRRVPMPIQRMRAEDLLAAVFPAQLACPVEKPRSLEPPDHPLVQQTIHDCLHEAMDLDGAIEVVRAIERGEICTVAVETPSPSPMSHELLNANPYAFLDDAPLEERRARAVSLRRSDPDLAQGLGALDPEVIALVREQAWPDVRDAEELHDALLTLGQLPRGRLGAWEVYLPPLLEAGRAQFVGDCLIATERLSQSDPSPMVQGWLECLGPTTPADLASQCGLLSTQVESALAQLEARGMAMRGRFTPGSSQEEWCERRLLSRIHRLTIGKLRREIEPVSAAEFLRFLLRWQHVAPGSKLYGREGLLAIIRQLQGLELSAPAWEAQVLPVRLVKFDPHELDGLCLAGALAWGRAAPSDSLAFSRQAPIGMFLREDLPVFLGAPWPLSDEASREARAVLGYLEAHGASFVHEMARGLHMLPAAVETALWELIARGLVTGDGLAGLRLLLDPEDRRKKAQRKLPRLVPTGRWSRWGLKEAERRDENARMEGFARQLLARWGVVFRELLARESLAPPWRELVSFYRRLEARGELRGGRFVAGFLGEQFALPSALETLRALRREAPDGKTLLVSAADALNLVGILTPGARVSPLSGQTIAYRDGVPIEVGALGRLRSRLRILPAA